MPMEDVGSDDVYPFWKIFIWCLSRKNKRRTRRPTSESARLPIARPRPMSFDEELKFRSRRVTHNKRQSTERWYKWNRASTVVTWCSTLPQTWFNRFESCARTFVVSKDVRPFCIQCVGRKTLDQRASLTSSCQFRSCVSRRVQRRVRISVV